LARLCGTKGLSRILAHRAQKSEPAAAKGSIPGSRPVRFELLLWRVPVTKPRFGVKI
jgi:hypothetical protein